MTIFQSTQTCNKAFANYSAAATQKIENSLYEQLHTRFKVWRDYSGATERDGIRLDNRLSDFPQVAEVFIDLLEIISQGLNNARATQSSQPASDVSTDKDVALKFRPDHSLSLEESEESREQKPWNDILLAVNELMKLTTMIRRSSSSNSRYQNAYPAPEGENPLLKLYYAILVRREFPDARTSLTRLLSDSIIQRRRRLLRQQRRQVERSALEITHQAGEMGTLPRHEEVVPGSATTMLELEHHQPQKRFPPSEISRPGPSIVHRFRDMSQPAESIIGRSRPALEPALYPPLPQHDSENPGFTKCPYCFEPLALPLLTQAWRDHVDKDLQIYVCLSETCAANLKFFDSSTSWSQHMTEHHHPSWPQKIHLGVWYCNLGHPKDVLFTNVEGFRAHYETKHPEIYANDRQMKAHIRRDRKPGQRDEHFCPLCENQYDRWATFLSYPGLLQHIREHLRYLAMFSLPFVESTTLLESPDVISDACSSLSLISNNDCASPRGNDSVDSFVWGEQTYNIVETPIETRHAGVQESGVQQNILKLHRVFNPNTGVQVIVEHRPPLPKDLQAERINVHQRIVGTADSAERLFPDYIVQPSRFFCLGRVFLVLWAEPVGGSVVTTLETGTIRNDFGKLVTSKVRRFVVIRQSDQYCIALPIQTYSGRGVAKRGVVKSEHAIIYTGRVPLSPRPEELPARGEMGMMSVPIRVDPDTATDRLDPMSRLNFAQVSQVEHNVKARNLGMVSKQSMDDFRRQFANVWTTRPRPRPGATRNQAQMAPHETSTAGTVGGSGASTDADNISNSPREESDDDGNEEEESDEDDEGEAGEDEEPSSKEVDCEDE